MTDSSPLGPVGYMNRYLRLLYQPDSDPTAWVSVKQYLMNDGGARARKALGAKDALLSQAMAEIKWKNVSAPPPAFKVGDRTCATKAIVEAFMGKGSPDQIADVLWLAHRYGVIQNSGKKPPKEPALSAQGYCDAYLGLDCNGFVGNYFGIDPDTPIATYDVKSVRRSSVQRPRERDVLVWVKDAAGYPHIALLDSFPSTAGAGEKSSFRVVQASGKDGLGLHDSVYDEPIRTGGAGIYFEDPLRQAKVYFVAPPLGARSPKP